MDKTEKTPSLVEIGDGKQAEADMPLKGENAERQPVMPTIRLQRITSLWANHAQHGFVSCRLVLMLMGFFAFFNCYTLRVNLSVAMVAMVNISYLRELEAADANLSDSSSVVQACGDNDDNTTLSNVTEQTGVIFNWDEKAQGHLLGAFFYGYAATNIVGGMIAQKVGGKLLLLFGVFWTAFLTLLTPILTTAGGFAALFAVRLLEGFGEGVTFPAMATLLSQWAPPLERSKMTTFIYAGTTIGTVIGMTASGILCQFFGWESVFYVFGVIGVIWSVMWFFLVYNSPAKHPRISAEEREFIEKALDKKADVKGSVRVPWLSFAKCLPLYALAVAHFTCTWGYYTLLTCLPQYFRYILQFDIKSNGFVSGAPYLLMWLMMLLGGTIADLLQKKKLLSTTNVRKLANAVGFILPAICLVSTGYVNCNAYLAVVLITAAVGFSGICFAGFSVNHLDLAPPYAGTMMGITNTFATLSGFIGPAVVGALTYRNQTLEAWRVVFYIAAGVYAFGTIFYGLFGSGKLQSWAKPPQSANDAEVELNVLNKEKSET